MDVLVYILIVTGRNPATPDKRIELENSVHADIDACNSAGRSVVERLSKDWVTLEYLCIPARDHAVPTE